MTVLPSYKFHTLSQGVLDVFPPSKTATLFPTITLLLYLLIRSSLKHVWVFFCTWNKRHQRQPYEISPRRIRCRALVSSMPVLRVSRKIHSKGRRGCLTGGDHILQFGSGSRPPLGCKTNQRQCRCHRAEPPYITLLFAAYTTL